MARGDQLGRQWRIIQTLISSRLGRTAAQLAEAALFQTRPPAQGSLDAADLNYVYADSHSGFLTTRPIHATSTGSDMGLILPAVSTAATAYEQRLCGRSPSV